jgi:transaldolase
MDGWVSVEVAPGLADDTAGTVEQAEWLFEKAPRPNVFVKIPGTRAGVPAIEEATFRGVPVNVTLLFSEAQYVAAAEAYMRGLERRVEAGLDPDIRSVASLFLSRWDKYTADSVPDHLRNRLGIAVGALSYKAYRDLMETDRWQRLVNLGARPQRLLFASTGTKDPTASDVLYIEALAAPNTIDTMPEETLLAFADHGRLPGTLPRDGGEGAEVVEAFTRAGIDVVQLAETLQVDGAKAFVDSWQRLGDAVAAKKEAV